MAEKAQANRRRRMLAAAMSAIAVALAVASLTAGQAVDWYAAIGFIIAGGLLGTRTVRLAKSLGTVSVGFMLVFAAVIELGPAAGMIVGAAAGFGGTLLCSLICRQARRPRPMVVLGAMGNIALAAGLAGWVYSPLETVCSEAGLPYGVLPAFVALGAYYLVNSLGVALMVSADGSRPLLGVWSDNLSWTVLPFYLGGAVVLLVHVAAVALGPYVWLALIPPVTVIHLALEYRAKARFYRQARPTATVKAADE